MIKIMDDLYFSSDRNDMDLGLIFNFLKKTYWGNLRTLEEQKKANENTLNFGLFKNGKQIAFSRIMTDKVFFAYVLDVFVIHDEQGKGYSKILMDYIMKDPELQKIDKWILATKDAHALYEKFGFEKIKKPEMLMEKLSDRAKKIYE
ncbi:GNAT family N-acetyltransferase [uncultured Polaribacter sp.]|uniref:GNAT family N-acetyltransferase n=1 Tax=uncultured Polaribacter sp. TaxID=174711 RepID=UPI0030D9AC89|tara:strand:+ start:427 stop:867 length:441 start_codon:yes stop_codon:yes gene_type:complete